MFILNSEPRRLLSSFQYAFFPIAGAGVVKVSVSAVIGEPSPGGAATDLTRFFG